MADVESYVRAVTGSMPRKQATGFRDNRNACFLVRVTYPNG